MDPVTTDTSSKVWVGLVAVLIVVVTAGTLVVFYGHSRQTASVVPGSITTPTPTVATTPASNDPVLASTATVTASISDLDTQLAQINADLQSTDDISPNF